MNSVQSLENQLADIDPGETRERVDALNELAWEIGLNETRRAYALALEARSIADRLEYRRGRALANRTVAYCSMFFGRMKDAIDLIRATLGEFQELGEIMGESTGRDILSNAYMLIGSYDQALQESLQSLTINRLIRYARGEAWALNNIGNIWFEVGDMDKALDHFVESLEKFRSIPYAPGESSTLLRIGKLHEAQNHFEQALEVLLEGSRLAEDSRTPYFANRSYSEIGRVYRKMGRFELAMDYFRKSLRAYQRSNAEQLNIEALLDLADLKRDLEQWESARRLLVRSLRKIGDGGFRALQYRAHGGLSVIYERLGDYKKSLEHERLYHAIKEDVFNEETGARLRNMQIRLEVEGAEKEAEIHRLRSVELKELNNTLEERTRALDLSLRQLRDDLRLARDIQQKILPDVALELPGLDYHYEYHPIDQVGGDFLDIALLEPGRVRIFMADAVGHGVQASLITMALKSEYEELKPNIECPTDLVCELNRRIRRKYRRLISYVPAFLVDLRLDEGKLQYCSAGTMDQVLVRGDAVQQLSYSGPSLGMLEAPNIAKRELPFLPGDRLFLFTDGITESFNAAGDLFGEERVMDLARRSAGLSMRESLERMLLAMHDFRAADRPQDDVTLIGARFEAV